MKPKALIATVTAAILAGAGGWLASVGMGDAGYLANTPLGRWLGVRATANAPASDIAPAQVGQLVGPMPLHDLDGRPYSLPAGRPVLVNLWASWCAPCREEMPALARFAAAQGGHGVAVVGVAEDDIDGIRAFLRTTPVAYPIVRDDAQWRAGTRLGNGLGVLPFTALLDRDGRLQRVRSGPFASEQEIAQWASAPP